MSRLIIYVRVFHDHRSYATINLRAGVISFSANQFLTGMLIAGLLSLVHVTLPRLVLLSLVIVFI